MTERPSTTRRTRMVGTASSGNGDLRLQRLGGCVIVRLSGEFDISNALELQRVLRGLTAEDHVVIDLSRVRLLDATALRALATAHAEATRSGTSLQLADARGAVRQLLARTGLDTGLGYHDDTVDAVEAALAAREPEPALETAGPRATVASD